MSTTSNLKEELIAAVYREARLLDEGRYDEWRDQLTADAHYWVPADPADTDPLRQPALIYEDRLLLDVRIERLNDPRAHSLQPRVRCLHVLQQPEVLALNEAEGSADVEVRYVYLETQGDRQVVLGAVARQTWLRQNDSWRLQRKRVDLLNVDAPLPMVQLLP